MITNSPTNIQDYPCPNHPQERVSHFCTSLKCLEQPFLCAHCFSEGVGRLSHANHEEALVLVHEGVSDMAVRIDASRAQMRRLHQSTLGRREHAELLRRLEQPEYASRLADHVNQVKLQVERESEQLQLEFQRRLQAAKQDMFQQLDAYLQAHCANVQAFRELAEPLAEFERRLRPLANPNCLAMHLLAELKRRSALGAVSLKRCLSGASRLLAEKQSCTVEMFNRASVQLEAMLEELPCLRAVESPETRSIHVQAFLNEQLHDRLVVREVKPLVLDAH